MRARFILIFSIWLTSTMAFADLSVPTDTLNVIISSYLDMNSGTTDNSANTSIRIASKTSYFHYGLVAFAMKDVASYREKVEIGFQVYETAPGLFQYHEKFVTVMEGGRKGFLSETNQRDSVHIYFPHAAKAPFSVTYTDGTTPVTFNNITTRKFSYEVIPTTTVSYTLTASSDANGPIPVSGSATFTVVVLEPVTFELFQQNQIVTDNTTASFVADKLQITVSASNARYPGFRIYAPDSKWNLNQYERVGIEIRNLGTNTVNLSCWAVTNGWGGIGGYGINGSNSGTTTITIGAQATRIQYIYIHSKYMDNLHKMVNPEEINYFDIRFASNTAMNSKIEVKRIFVDNPILPDGDDKTGRLVVPPLEDQLPAQGKRVKQQLADYNGTQVFHTLYLPTDWEPGKKYPVIVEYAPNIFYDKACYSTGKVEDLVNGYGISKGEHYIWLGLPFVSADGKYNEVNAWGNADATVNYALKAVRMVCENYGGDPAGVFITGFSRGAIATGYIALRNDIIADTWIGFNACQHTDGGGWNGSEIGAASRVARLKGRPVYLIDNDSFPWVTMVPAAGSPMQKDNSGIGAHSAANYLDDRPSMVKLRQWFADTYLNKPGTVKISGYVTDQDGKPLANVLIESGSIHFVKTDENGFYEMKGLIRGSRNFRCSSEFITEKITDFTLVNDTVINFHVQLKDYSGLTNGESQGNGLVNTIADEYLFVRSDAHTVYSSILDLNGSIRLTFANNERKLNVSTLESGMYLLRIISENKQAAKRFLKI